MFGHLVGPDGLCHCRARAGDSLPLCRPPTANPDRYSDELLDAYLSIDDVDALYAEYATRGVEFTGDLPICHGIRVSLW